MILHSFANHLYPAIGVNVYACIVCLSGTNSHILSNFLKKKIIMLSNFVIASKSREKIKKY